MKKLLKEIAKAGAIVMFITVLCLFTHYEKKFSFERMPPYISGAAS